MGLRRGRGGVLVAILAPLVTTAALFLGPLMMELSDGRGEGLKETDSLPLRRSAAAWRDLVVSPISEEFVFRTLTLEVLTKAVGFR